MGRRDFFGAARLRLQRDLVRSMSSRRPAVIEKEVA
jgi:hypothetical protein